MRLGVRKQIVAPRGDDIEGQFDMHWTGTRAVENRESPCQNRRKFRGPQHRMAEHRYAADKALLVGKFVQTPSTKA